MIFNSPETGTKGMTMTEMQTAIETFCAKLTTVTNARYAEDARRYGNPQVCSVEFHPDKPGKRFVRIVRDDLVHGQKSGCSVHCFVELATGLMWKPDGWKKPALNFPRGNVLTTEVATEYCGRA